jgi:hypothetical protein
MLVDPLNCHEVAANTFHVMCVTLMQARFHFASPDDSVCEQRRGKVAREDEEHGQASLSSALQRWSGGLRLHLDKRKVGDEGVLLLLERIRSTSSWSTLARIELRSNSIGPRGIATLCTWFDAEDCNLLHLNLWNNVAKAEGARLLSDSIRNGGLRRLESFNLGRNMVRDKSFAPDFALCNLHILTFARVLHADLRQRGSLFGVGTGDGELSFGILERQRQWHHRQRM